MLLKLLILTITIHLSMTVTTKERGDFPRVRTDVQDLQNVVGNIDTRVGILEDQDCVGKIFTFETIVAKFLVDCGDPPEREHMDAHVFTTTLGAVVDYFCVQNYVYKSGSGVSQCQQSGQWSDVSLQCEDVCSSKNSKYTFVPSLRLCVKLSAFDDAIKYDPARISCAQDGARLIVVDTQEKYNFMMQYLTNLGDKAHQSGMARFRIWIGMERRSGRFWWNDGSEHVVNNYKTLWESGEPDMHISQNCVQFLSDGFSDVYCSSESRRYMCEIVLG